MKRARDVREQLLGLMDRVEVELVSNPGDHDAVRAPVSGGVGLGSGLSREYAGGRPARRVAAACRTQCQCGAQRASVGQARAPFSDCCLRAALAPTRLRGCDWQRAGVRRAAHCVPAAAPRPTRAARRRCARPCARATSTTPRGARRPTRTARSRTRRPWTSTPPPACARRGAPWPPPSLSPVHRRCAWRAAGGKFRWLC